MCEFCASAESITAAILVVVFGAVCYLAGRGDILMLIPTVLKEKLDELIDSIKEKDGEANEKDR